jgi:hypothetical protein
MKATLQSWLELRWSQPGILAAWLAFPADLFDVARLHRLSAAVIRWRFERAQIYCARRAEGTVLGLLLPANLDEEGLDAMELLLAEFVALKDESKPAAQSPEPA